ncbi:MAG TPA: DUF1161 domain-containing protein [Nevskia sp.]|nr:DUF1161 domain-containing protein [Nevskia sp.]
MKLSPIVIAALLGFAAASASATPCDEVKSQIEAKVKGHGVKAYTLEVIDAAGVKEQKVVGSCEGGKKKIVYKRS